MSKLVWKVTEIDPDRPGPGCRRSPGVNASARHWVIPQPDGRTLVRQQLEQRGVIGALVGRMMLEKTKRFLATRGPGLKDRSEQLHRADGPPS